MWETLQNNADWDCFKTLILQEILRTRNLSQVEHCVFLEATRSFQSAECARNRLQFRTAQQNQKSFPWMQVLGWTVDPRLTCGIWSLLFFTEIRTKVNKKQGDLSTYPTRKKIPGKIDDLNNVDFVSSNANSSRKEAVLYIRQWSSDQDDHEGKKPYNETCLQNPQSCFWLVVWQNQFGSQDPNQIHRHQEPTRRPYWQREISHVTSGTIFCDCSTLAISAPSTASKRCRKEHKVKKESQQNQSRWWFLVSRCRERDPTVLASTASENPENTNSESQKVLLSSLNVQQTGTGRPVMLASSSNSSEWNNDDEWSSQVRKSGEMSETSTERVVSNNLIIEWPIAKDAEPFSRRFNARHWQTFYDLENVYVFDRLGQFTFHQKYRRNSHFKEDVRDIWTVGTIGWDFWRVSNQLEKFSMETVFSGQWWRSHQSLACWGFRILRFCGMSWKDQSEPNIKYCLGATVGMVQRFITIDGEPMEFEWNMFPGFTTMELVREVQWHHRWNKDNETECIANSTHVSLFAKKFPAGLWSFLGPGTEIKWYSTKKDQEENGIESLNWWW